MSNFSVFLTKLAPYVFGRERSHTALKHELSGTCKINRFRFFLSFSAHSGHHNPLWIGAPALVWYGTEEEGLLLLVQAHESYMLSCENSKSPQQGYTPRWLPNKLYVMALPEQVWGAWGAYGGFSFDKGGATGRVFGRPQWYYVAVGVL